MKLSKKLQAESQSEKDMYQKMLGQKPPAKTNKQSENSSSVVRQLVFLIRQLNLVCLHELKSVLGFGEHILFSCVLFIKNHIGIG